MLSALIASALLVSVSGLNSDASAVIQKLHVKAHGAVKKHMQAAGQKVSFKATAGNAQYAKVFYAEEDSASCSTPAQYYMWMVLNTCVTDGSGSSMMMMDTMGESVNVTQTMFNTDDCMGESTTMSMLYPYGCHDDNNAVMGDTVNYLMSIGAYKESGYGFQDFNSNEDCIAGSGITSATEMIFGMCYDYGGGMYLSVDNCNSAYMGPNADCTGMDDDFYNMDDDMYDDGMDDDTDGCGAGTSKFYCSSSSSGASSLATPSVFAMIAATAAAVVAMM